jgi:hypothetical protein
MLVSGFYPTKLSKAQRRNLVADKVASLALLRMEKLLIERNLSGCVKAITRGANIILLSVDGEIKFNLLRFRPCGVNKYELDVSDSNGKWFDDMNSGTMEELLDYVDEYHPGFLSGM